MTSLCYQQKYNQAKQSYYLVKGGADDERDKKKNSIKIVSWNILTPDLCNADKYSYNKKEYLDPLYRQNLFTEFFRKNAPDTDIMIFQEITIDWFTELSTQLESHNFKAEIADYENPVKGTKMGVAILWNNSRFEKRLNHKASLSDYIFSNISKYSSFGENVIVEAMKEYKEAVIVHLYDRKAETNLVVANYHFPCKFLNPDLMMLHFKANNDMINDFMSDVNKTVPLNTEIFTILGTDTNTRRKVEHFTQMVSTNWNFHEHSTPTTYCRKAFDVECFEEIIDYIFYSKNLKTIDFHVEFGDEKIIAPHASNPSDHRPLFTTLQYSTFKSLEHMFKQFRDETNKCKSDRTKRFNGLKYWREGKKKECTYLDKHVFKFKRIGVNKDDYMHVMCLDEKDEYNHFMKQLFRIPLREKCTYRKIMQLALNIGQLKGIAERDNHKVFKYFDLYKLNDLSTYVDASTIREMSKLL